MCVQCSRSVPINNFGFQFVFVVDLKCEDGAEIGAEVARRGLVFLWEVQ